MTSLVSILMIIFLMTLSLSNNTCNLLFFNIIIVYIVDLLGATDTNGQGQGAVTGAGSYQSSGGSPESHTAMSPLNNSPQHNGAIPSPGTSLNSSSDHNGALDSSIHSAVILRDLSDPDDYRIPFKQEPSLETETTYWQPAYM